MENELTHYGVKGMKWGVRRDLKRYKKVNDWRVKVNTRKSEKWAEKAENSKFKSPLNPLYNSRLGKAQSYSKRAEERQELSDMCEKLIQAHDTLMSNVDIDAVNAGRMFVKGKLSEELERRAREIM